MFNNLFCCHNEKCCKDESMTHDENWKEIPTLIYLFLVKVSHLLLKFTFILELIFALAEKLEEKGHGYESLR